MAGKLKLKIKQGETFHYDEKDKEALSRILADALPSGSYEFDDNQNLCKMPDSYIGILELPTKTIDIMPSISGIGMKQVQMMYFFVKSETWDLLEAKTIFDFAGGTLSESIAKKFIRELNQVVQKGLPHLYQERDMDLRYLKGQINLEKTFENLSMMREQPFHCNYEETSMNNPVSRILGAAIYKIESLLPNEFIRLARYLPFCTVEEGQILCDRYLASYKKRSYYNALYWASRVLYDLQVISLGLGQMGSSFLIDFYLLFQEFCYKVLKVFGEHYSLNANSLVKLPLICYEKRESGDHNLKTIRPDILYRFDRYSKTAEAVLDSKCKEELFLPSDIYQIEFYSTCLLARKCVLLYPKGLKSNSGANHKILRINEDFKNVYSKEIIAVYLDLSSNTFEDFVASMNNFAQVVSKVVLFQNQS